MADKSSNVPVYKPSPNDAVSVRHIHSTKEDRAQHLKDFREEKKFQENVKTERFKKIQERRKAGGPSGGKGGINIEVKGD